jgi:hypothetical protein
VQSEAGRRDRGRRNRPRCRCPGGRLARADTLARQQEAGTLAERASIQQRAELRRAIQEEFLPLLVRVGQSLGAENPDLAGRFRMPGSHAPHRTFVDSTRRMLAIAMEDRARFEAGGLTASFLDDFTAIVGSFEAATGEAHRGKEDHVGAVADLRAVTDEIVKLVGKLDGLNRYRFRKDPELRAAWESARDVVGPFRLTRPVVEPAPDTLAHPTQ